MFCDVSEDSALPLFVSQFIIEDMKQQQTNKHNNLHREDQHITVEELWRSWKTCEVHNWTVEDSVQWLKESVELPQYEKNFRDFGVTGNTLPRLVPSLAAAENPLQRRVTRSDSLVLFMADVTSALIKMCFRR
ncbi:stromal interaction molecule 2-like [Plectropomus leopardus]|uniref:stromal interaction molecule 2-like n=1 Tax=Plectropomus leopardus TaxID=160734 RepID=UPI001C4AAFE9|nr:stromal interaction molecule 2-like [Plectropomus leopardus]